MNKTDEFAGAIGQNSTYSKYYKKNYETNGSPKGYDLEALVHNPQDNTQDIIALAKYYYYKNGLIMRVLNIIRDFGIGKPNLYFPTKNKRAKKIIESFNKRVDIEQVLKDMIFELTLTGNLAGYNRDGKRIDIYPITKVDISPIIINNKPVLIYKNDIELDYIELPKGFKKKLDISYPKEVAEGIKKGKEKIVLDVNNTFFDKINSSRYEPYGVSFLLPAFDELAHKNILKEAEKATATGIIEKILRIGVGDKDHKPKQPEIDFYNNLVNGKSGSLKVTVPYFVNFEWIEPDSKVFGVQKFEQVDKDLLSALGVSLTLIRGEGGGNYSEGIISIAGLIKTIESIRSNIPKIIRDWYKQEIIKNGLSENHVPLVELPPVEIDNTARLEMVQWLFEHAGLPYATLYKEHGFDFTSVKLVRENENSEKLEDVFSLREQPFQGKAGRPELKQNQRTTDKSMSNNNLPRPSTR